MKAPGSPDNEVERVARLESYQLLDTEPDAALDGLTLLASEILDVPIALVSLVDRDRQWFKSRRGLDVPQTSREVSFCGHVVADGSELVVADTLADPRFADNPLVVDDPRIRFYAGVPLRDVGGLDLGTFCVIDRRPRELSPAQRTQLRLLADLAMQRIETIGKLAITQCVIDAVPGMLAYWDQGQRCRFANAAYQQWFGVRPTDLLGRTLQELLGPIYPKNLPYIEGALRGEEQLFEREIPDPQGGPPRHAQAHYVPNVSARGVVGFSVMVADISGLKLMEEELRAARAHAEGLARHDALTGLANRTNVEERLERIIAHSQRYQRRFAALYLDLDGFKHVNDTSGHAAGDEVLRTAARRLLAVTRKSDIVGRLGGDEFVVVIPEYETWSQVTSIAQKFIDAIKSPPIMISGKPAGVTVSVGIAVFPNDGTEIGPLLAVADEELYRAKRLGKDRFSFREATSRLP